MEGRCLDTWANESCWTDRGTRSVRTKVLGPLVISGIFWQGSGFVFLWVVWYTQATEPFFIFSVLIHHPRAQRHRRISPPWTSPLRASPNRASVLYTMNHARQCAMRIVNKRTRNIPARTAMVVHRIDTTGVASSLRFLGCSLAFTRGCPLDVRVPGAVSLEDKFSTRSPLGPCSVRVIGGSTSHLRPFSISLRFGVVGKGGSHGFRGSGVEIVLSLDESVPSVIGRLSSFLC
jgi:hypothetical protein